jgi:hypothetical protein
MISIAHEYHIVELHMGIPSDVVEWCETQFGQPGRRWFTRSPRIYFTNQMDHMMFLLRWS